VGAGLPTQQDGWNFELCFFFVIPDVFSELRPFGRGHCFEKDSHLFYSRFSQSAIGRLGAVSGIMPFSFARVTRSSYVYSVLLVRRISRLCGARSTGRHVGCPGACFHVLVYPSQERGGSSRHIVVRVLSMRFCVVSSQCALSFGIWKKKSSLMSPPLGRNPARAYSDC